MGLCRSIPHLNPLSPESLNPENLPGAGTLHLQACSFAYVYQVGPIHDDWRAWVALSRIASSQMGLDPNDAAALGRFGWSVKQVGLQTSEVFFQAPLVSGVVDYPSVAGSAGSVTFRLKRGRVHL